MYYCWVRVCISNKSTGTIYSSLICTRVHVKTNDANNDDFVAFLLFLVGVGVVMGQRVRGKNQVTPELPCHRMYLEEATSRHNRVQ